jgi:hypothetical protein
MMISSPVRAAQQVLRQFALVWSSFNAGVPYATVK